jgi:hypothetical protein
MVILAIHSIYFSLFLNVFRSFVIYQPLDQQKKRKHERKNWRGSISSLVLFGGASHSYEQSSKWKCVPFCLLNPLDES